MEKKIYKGRMVSDFRLNTYAFIKPEDSSVDVFVHVSGLMGNGEPRIGDPVTFEMEMSPKTQKLIAVNVRTLY